MNVLVRTAAREDILRQFAYYLDEKDAPATARRFLDAVESAIGILGRMPRMGAPRRFKNPVLEGLRSRPIQGFRAMRIYYIHNEDTLRIIRVLHGKRDVQSLLEKDAGEDEDQ